MADNDFTSVYRQFFEEFGRTVKPQDPLPIGVPAYNVALCEMTGEVIELSIQYLTLMKCPQSLYVPIIKIAVDEIQEDLKKQLKNVYNPLEVMRMTTSKINEICLRFTDNEKMSSLPPPVKEPWYTHHGIRNTRRKMEDRLICLPRFHELYSIPCTNEASYYGLFDGHNGTTASSFAVAHLHQFLAESPHYPQDPVTAFYDAYQTTESLFLAKKVVGGSTALAILHQIKEKKIIVSWLGDSQAMLVKQEGYLLLTDPHKPGRRDEYKRIKDLGGFVLEANGSYRISGQLAVSRAIGDDQFKPFVSPRPDVRVVDFTGSEEFLVIGCDGLWDVVKPQEVIEAVYSQIKENPDNIDLVSRRLINLAKENRSSDNISVIVVFFADPVDISKRSVEAIGPRPKNPSEGKMDTDYTTATEKSPFVALSDQGMNRIYEENGTHLTCMDQLKEDSDEYFGPETDVDAVDDVLVSPNKCVNPFTSDMWKKGGSDCDASSDLIDYSKQENIDKDLVNFSENINNFLKDNCENNVEELTVREPLDNAHMNQLNSSYPVDSPGIKFSDYSCVKNEFIEDIKVEKDVETSGNSDFKDNAYLLENEREFIQENNYTGFDNVQNNLTDDFGAFDQKNVEQEAEDLISGDETIFNGNVDDYSNDKLDLEKPVFSPEETPVSDLEERLSNAGDASETAELRSPSVPNSDDKFKDEVIAESGGEGDSEDDEWDYIKGDTGTPADASFELVAVSQQVEESEKPAMNTQLNPDAAEFFPVTPITNPVEAELQKTPLRSIPSSVNDIIASSPKWNDMDDVVVPDEFAFMSEIKSRPSNLFEDDEVVVNDPEGLGCRNLDNNEADPKIFEERDQCIPEPDGPSLHPHAHGIALATDMTSSFIDTSTMSVETDVSKQTMETIMQKMEAPELETHSTLNADAAEFKFSVDNNVSHLLPPQDEDLVNKEAATFDPVEEPNVRIIENEIQTSELENFVQSPFPVQKVDPIVELSNLTGENPIKADWEHDFIKIADPVETAEQAQTELVTNEAVKTEVIATEEAVETEPILKNDIMTEATPVESINMGATNVEDIKPEAILMENVKAEEVEPFVTPVRESDTVAAAVAAAAVAATAVAAVSVAEIKEEPKKSTTPTAKTPTSSKVTKTAVSPRTTTTPTVKKTTPVTSKLTTTKFVNNTVSSASSVKSTVSKVSTTTRTVAAKPTPAATSRPLVRKTTPTSTSTVPKPMSAKPLASKTSTTAVRATAVSTTSAPKVTSTVAAPKPKPRVPSSLVLAKKPSVTSSSSVTTTTRTTTTRPASAPVKSTVKTTVTTARTTTTSKPKTPLTGITTTAMTNTTRTVLNSKKPLSVTAKSTVGSKPLAKTAVSKVNGLPNGTTKTKTPTSKVENKTDIKADVVEKSVDVIKNDIEKPIIENLVNGKDHD